MVNIDAVSAVDARRAMTTASTETETDARDILGADRRRRKTVGRVVANHTRGIIRARARARAIDAIDARVCVYSRVRSL